MTDKNEMEMDELQDDLLLGSDDEEEIISDLDDDMILDEDTLKIAEAYLSDEEEEEDIDFGSEDEEEEAELDFEDRPKRRFYDDEDVEVEDEIDYFESRKPSSKVMLHEGRKPRHLKRISEKYAPTKRGLKGPRYNYDESFNRSKVRKSHMLKEAVRQSRRNRKLQESRKMRSPFSKRRFR